MLNASERKQEVEKRTISSSVIKVGAVSSSQDGVIVSPEGVAPTHTAGHGNCPKIISEE